MLPIARRDFRTYFVAAGVRLVPRTAGATSWDWGLSWVGYGRGSSLAAPTEAVLVPGANRIEYRRPGLSEWYLNEARGLEQGFTVENRPGEGGECEEPLVLALALAGGLSPRIEEGGSEALFVSPAGEPVLRYGDLFSQDATGRELPVRLEGFAAPGIRGIRLIVDDRDAVYPIEIDPLITGPAWTAEGNQVDADFGFALGTAGDVNGDGYSDIVVAAPWYDNGEMNEGRIFVYHGSPSGPPTVATWTAESNQEDAYMGRNTGVGTAGDVNGDGYSDLIVSASCYDVSVQDDGLALLFLGSSTGLDRGGSRASGTPSNADWSRPFTAAYSIFGWSVATAGDVNGDGYSDVIIGAHAYDNGYPGSDDRGKAFVYNGSPAGLSANSSWAVEGERPADNFGYSVSTAGDVNGDGYADVIVGAWAFDNGQTDEGKAYVYLGSTTGLATTPSWTTESNQGGARLGISVATAGDVNGDGYADVIVGAYAYDNGETDEGRVLVFHGSATGPGSTPAWVAEGNQTSALLGISVNTAGDVNGDGYADAIVGAQGYDNVEVDEGRAFVYLGSASGLSSTPVWTAEPDQAQAYYGGCVATAGDVNGDGFSDLLVGAYAYDSGEVNEGRAHLYRGSPSGPAANPGWSAESDQTEGLLGHSVSTAGDINGDGYADVIVGAPYYDNGQIDEGRAFLFTGSAAGLSPTPSWTAESDQAGAAFGRSVAGAGDLNGDGYDDVVVGAMLYSNGETGEGRVFAYHGSVSGLSATQNWTAESNQVQAWFGGSVAGAGDVDGDGYADVVVGATRYSNDQPREGRVFLYRGSATGLFTTPSWTAESDQTDSSYGASVASAGDVNRDGFADVVVGASTYTNGQTFEGRAYLYLGSASGLGTTPSWTAESNNGSAYFGRSVASAGDVNGDGYSDVIVGAYGFSNDQSGEGRAYIYRGSSTGLAAAAAWTSEGNQIASGFGIAAAGAGDVNGDGYADVIVGAHQYDNGQADEGRAHVYLGSAAGPAASPAWTWETDQSNAVFGYSATTAGDVNGDGYADVIVGAAQYDNGHTNEGRAYLFYGGGGPGQALEPQQRRATDAAPIAHLGSSDAPDRFRLGLLGRTPFGRGRVKLEWETKPLALALNGIDTKTGVNWTDTGTDGTSVRELESGLRQGLVHHWRARLRYDPVTVPFQRRSRWFSVPWHGWQEGDLRTGDPHPAGRTPDGVSVSGTVLTIQWVAGGELRLSWGLSCIGTDFDYAVYEGVLGSFTSHRPVLCSTAGDITKVITPREGNAYYLVVPLNATREGSYGMDSAGRERPQGAVACLVQEIGSCP